MVITALSMLILGQASIDARLMRFPAIYDGTVIFTYAGDLWTVPEAGGIARRLTSHPGAESLAKFSPDGKQVAFTGFYDGNTDVYVMPSEGGEPKRLTFHPDADVTVGWTPDGKNVLFRSTRTSVSGRYQKLFMVAADGGTPKELPMDECGLASPSPDGSTYAYNRVATENAAWKRYRGGLQSYVSFYDVRNNKYWEMQHDESAYLWPMWVDNRVFYTNDSDGRLNLYSYDTATKKQKKLTNFNDFDIKWPNYGTGKIVFERDAKLWTYSVTDGAVKNIPVRIMSDMLEARPYRMNLGDRVSDISISPSGGRLAIEARGEIFDVPAKEGLTYNITKTPGARERFPRWSPDGKTILFTSDKTGEYEFYTQKADLTSPPTQLTSGAVRFRNAGAWSPDSKKFFYTDSMNALYIVDVATKAETKVGKGEYPAYNDTVWSPDSKWLAYSKSDSTGLGKVFVYSLDDGKETQVNKDIFDDANPMFDAESKYLFFVSLRDFNPSTGALELNFNISDGQRIYGYTLNRNTASPFAPKNEDVGEEKPADNNPQQNAGGMDLNGIDTRLFVLPLPPGGYALHASAPGKLYYSSGQTVSVFDFASKKPQTIIENVSQFDFTPKADKMAYVAGPVVGVVPTQPGQAVGAGKVDTANMEAEINPRAEWKQSYWEAWRYERDYYWTANMGGLDWRGIGEKYARWLPYVAHRSDLDYMLRELLGELSTGHAYVIPGFTGGGRVVPIGLLGADYETVADGVRFKKVYRGQNWDSSRRAPLNEPGMNIKDGDYLLAIDGDKVTRDTNVEELLVGKANKVVEVTVNSTPTMAGARKLLVRTVGNEGGLRYADWVESRLKYVQDKTGGRVAYVHVPSTSTDGIIEFYKMFYPQVDKDAIIVDERYNSGGYIPDFFVEKLARTALVQWTPRDLGDFRSPGAAVIGPKVMLINHYGGSGGDAFPYFFRKMKIGPLVGTRTWGGLVGIFGTRDLMSGGGVTVPQFAIWDVDSRGVAHWVVENQGVAPDIEIDNRPDLVHAGQDPQLDKAIQVILDELKKNPPKRPKHPPFRGEKGG